MRQDRSLTPSSLGRHVGISPANDDDWLRQAMVNRAVRKFGQRNGPHGTGRPE